MKKQYTTPLCEVYMIELGNGLMDVSVYGYNNPKSSDHVDDGNNPQKDGNGTIWNSAKPHQGFSLWDDEW